LEGDRARTALEELDQFFKKWEQTTLTLLVKANTPEEAFRIACEFRAAQTFMTAARAAVAVGGMAEKELLKE
jgi:hypothetical protein